MASTSSSSHDVFNTPVNIYQKLLPDGTLDPTPVNESDYDMIAEYMKKTFEDRKLYKGLDEALKRTFVLKSTSDTQSNKSFVSKIIPQPKFRNLSKRKVRRQQQKVPRDLNYEQFLILNTLWNEYIEDLIKSEKKTEEIQQKLNRVDLHGALITVSFASSKTFIGLKGIVIKETKNAFVIATEKNLSKIIPKPEAIFDVNLKEPCGVMRIAGNSIISRPADRASKKVKSFMEFIGLKKYKELLEYTDVEMK